MIFKLHLGKEKKQLTLYYGAVSALLSLGLDRWLPGGWVSTLHILKLGPEKRFAQHSYQEGKRC